MSIPQWYSIGTLVGMMVLFLWGRFRYDVTAVIALLAALAFGIVAPADAFKGFADDIVIIVGSALVMSAAVQRSGVIETVLGALSRRITRVRSQLLLLVTSVGFASAFIKNVGALAMLMPAALQMARRSEASPSVFLMPMAFASLLGGLMTLVGTSPNVIVSRVREELSGEPFGMFDYFPTGFGLFVVGLIFLRFGYRLLPRDRRAAPSMGEALNIADYATEATIGAGSAAINETVADFELRHEHRVEVWAVIREGLRGILSPGLQLREADVLILGGEPDDLDRAIANDALRAVGDRHDDEEPTPRRQAGEIGMVEAVVPADSALIGRTARRLRLGEHLGIRLIAVSRAGARIAQKIDHVVLRAGDVIVLQGPLESFPDRLARLGALPLAPRVLRIGGVQRRWLPISILAVAMLATAAGWVPVAAAFFAAAALVVITGALPLDEAYEAIEWPILIMLGALIPVSASLQSTGASTVIGTALSSMAADLPPWGAVALILVASMAVTPFLNNAATVMVMAPIAAVFAGDLGLRPEAFLIATAVGAGCDFLTPIGHQCNTLVLGPGGYRFSDYARLGAPLSVLVVLVGTPLILWTWPV